MSVVQKVESVSWRQPSCIQVDVFYISWPETPSWINFLWWNKEHLNPFKLSGCLKCHHFNIHKFYILPTHCIYVFCVDFRTNSDHFPIQHHLTGFYKWVLTLCSPVVTIYTTTLTFTNSTFCPHSVFLCFLWIWEQTAIISLYSINWLVCITEI